MDKMIISGINSFSILSLSFLGLLLSGLIGPVVPAVQVVLYRFIFIILEYCVRFRRVTISAVVVRVEFAPLRVVISWTLNPIGGHCFSAIPLGFGLGHELLERGDLAPATVRTFPVSSFSLVGLAFFFLLLGGVLLLLLSLLLPPIVTFLVGIGTGRFVVPTLPTPHFFPQSHQFLQGRSWGKGLTVVFLYLCAYVFFRQ